MHSTPLAPLRLRQITSFFVGGGIRSLQGLPVEQRRFAHNGPLRPVDPNGDYVSGQMYVQAYLQEQPVQPLPLVLWHGGGMTGANWESTPDGRPGWLDTLLRAGFDVYVCDAVERGRAGWSRWPQIYTAAPLHRTLDEGWDMFRMGPPAGYRRDAAVRRAHAGQQFPVEAFDAFAAQWVPRWAGHEEITLQAYAALLQRLGRSIVIGHSQGGGFALEAARRWPQHVAAVAAIEPSGAPRPEQLAGSAGPLPPHLCMWGDFLAAHPVWLRYREAVDAYCAAVRASGAAMDLCDLPREGIHGNSHFPMMDRNSHQVAQRLLAWLHALAAPGAQTPPMTTSNQETSP